MGPGSAEIGGWKLTHELCHREAHPLHLPITVQHVVVLHRRQLHLQVGLTPNCGGPGQSKVSLQPPECLLGMSPQPLVTDCKDYCGLRAKFQGSQDCVIPPGVGLGRRLSLPAASHPSLRCNTHRQGTGQARLFSPRWWSLQDTGRRSWNQKPFRTSPL